METDGDTIVGSVKLPRAVRQQQERIAQIERERAAAENTEEVEVVTEPTVDTPPAPIESTPPKPVDVPKEETVDYWKSRFQVVDGLLKKQSGEWKAEKNELTQRLNAVEAQMARTARENQQFDIRKYVPESELEELDERQLAASVKAARAATRDDLEAELESRMAPIKQELEQTRETAQESQRNAFWDRVKSKVPNVEVINEDAGFLAWLQQKAPYQRVDRLTLLRRAEAELDAESVVEFFDEFLYTLPKPAPKAELPSPQIDPVPSPAPRGSDGTVVIRRSEIKKFYDDVRRGKIAEGSKAYENMERKIAEATRTGGILEA